MKRITRVFVYTYFFISSLSSIGQTVTELILVNASSDQDLCELVDSAQIDLATSGNSLNVRAEVSGQVGSVRFGYDSNQNVQTENTAPYAFAGDNNGNYNSWTPSIGWHKITAIPFSGANASGTSGDTVTIHFEVIESLDSSEVPYPSNPGSGTVTISGDLMKWHKTTLTFDGPYYAEDSMATNPFLDLRLTATFTIGNRSYSVPGYFAADGNASETSSTAGNQWRVHFSPDSIGTWMYELDFRIGKNIAVNEDPFAGLTVPPIHGQTGSFTILPSDKSGQDFRSKGRLLIVGDRYLLHAETKEFFIKGGADAPENLLAYDDIDNTPDNGGRRKSYSPHANDWNSGDPSWQNDKGTELIGALNYLAQKGVNVFSFLTMNIGGDDKNVFPYVSDSNFKRMDCSKLDQWEVIFCHADHLGLFLHFKTQETENDQLLDGGALGIERKLYYRELIARFSHHLGLNWNMGEENTQTFEQRVAMADFFATHDPYQHSRVIHTYPNQTNAVYTPLLGENSAYTGASIQTNWSNVHSETAKWVEASAQAGKTWIVSNDEQGNANTGVPPDPGYPGYAGSNPDFHDIRKQVLWGNLMAGGAGVEYYFGYQQPESDLSLQDFRSRDSTWSFVNYALTFFRNQPLPNLMPKDDLVSEGWCLAEEGKHYLIYLPEGGNTYLELTNDSFYLVEWFDPRNNTYHAGQTISGPGTTLVGVPPNNPTEDWVAVVSKQEEEVTSTDVFLAPNHLTLYPNPTQGQFTIKGQLGSYDIQIVNAQGQEYKQVQGLESLQVDISTLPQGLYFVVIRNHINGAIELQKILKQ